jgi:hypothetical protein
VAHFFRRTFDKLRSGGALGLIATNTIAQGDTRGTGLRHICTHGGTIFNARRRVKWPGIAAVVVSVVHVTKGDAKVMFRLDDREVDTITAFLFHAGGHEDPKPLNENEGKCFQGSIVLGMGFTFDDMNPAATPIAEMQRLLEKSPRNAERIFPYLGGEELNGNPHHNPSRFVINFGLLSEAEAKFWPDLLKILETKVKPERAKKSKDMAQWPWWRFWRAREELTEAVAGFKEYLAAARHQPNWAITYVPTGVVLSDATVAFAFDQKAALAVLQSRPHEVWTRFLGSSMKDDLRYTPSDCFETFPFPVDWGEIGSLASIGSAYYEHRAALMVRNGEGLTKTYNRFHDPDEASPDILRLRALHDAMDRAVLDAYGWADLRPACEFLLDYEDEDDEAEDSGRTRQRKKPWRFRWPDDVRDEVLARLLALNAARADEERYAVDPRRTPPSPPRSQPQKVG